MKKNITYEGLDKFVTSYDVEGTPLFTVYLEDGFLKIYPKNEAWENLADKGIEIKDLKFDEHGAPVCEIC